MHVSGGAFDAGLGGLLYGEPGPPFGIPAEYNPMNPNDYEELCRLRREKRRDEVSLVALVLYQYALVLAFTMFRNRITNLTRDERKLSAILRHVVPQL